jgi:hypothetical protein
MSRRKQGLNWRFPPNSFCFTPEKTTNSSSKEGFNLWVPHNSFALHHKKQQIQVPTPQRKDKTKTFLSHIYQAPHSAICQHLRKIKSVGEIRGLWDMISCSLFARMASSKCRWER